ncbi:MAG: hypothetical protein IGS49_07000 [Chlorogloeopsis fritschii C42_A2020_084]|uniref:hypothetical protein n=1 Tax=Chlorogloeopsis fritschii TaxID=1124 RepID=UPI0019EBBB76|nr:hypothetical protein [Chlorogloeopsis fritschii]MBF2005210.1 hypothetical protein [Chlorogloeopsis fritschii C42_A2020_084]
MTTFNQYQKGGWNNRIGALAIALAAIVLPACAPNQQQATTPQSPAAEAPDTSKPVAEKENVTAPDVSQKTDELIGKLVTVRSQPINRLNDKVFTITDREVFSGERIVVVNNTGQTVNWPIPQDSRLQVTGTVTKFDPNAIQQEYGLNLGQDSYREYEGRPAIIARSIALAPVPGEISEQPQKYYNKVIAVPAEVERIYSPSAFALEDDTLLGDNPLLVLVTDQIKEKAPIKQGERIVATGTLRPFVVTELERDYNFGWNQQLRGQLEKEYNTRPVLIVEGIYPSALPESAK